MTVDFKLVTLIRAEPRDAFLASLDIDAHLASMAASGEEAVAGTTEGIIGLGESVTWRAKHFGINWRMTSEITALDMPHCFVDQQRRGPFKFFWHEHRFEPADGGTRMHDHVRFAAPFGPIGRLVERLILGKYLQKLIVERNDYLKSELEAQR